MLMPLFISSYTFPHKYIYMYISLYIHTYIHQYIHTHTRQQGSSFQCGSIVHNLCCVTECIKYACTAEPAEAVCMGVSSLLEVLLHGYIHTLSYDVEENVWIKASGALHRVCCNGTYIYIHTFIYKKR